MFQNLIVHRCPLILTISNEVGSNDKRWWSSLFGTCLNGPTLGCSEQTPVSVEFLLDSWSPLPVTELRLNYGIDELRDGLAIIKVGIERHRAATQRVS